MVELYDVIKVLLRNKKVNTENTIFRLHCKFTVILLLLFSFMVTSKQYFGDPIDCDTGSQEKYIMDTYCWIYSTFTVKRHLKGEIGKTYIYPGVGPSEAILVKNTDEEIISHKYYQWVCIILFMQAVLFYVPKYVWKIWEAGRLEMLVKDYGVPIVQSNWNDSYKRYLTNYLLCHTDAHNFYFIRYVGCETLNFLNVCMQIMLMDWYLSGRFSNFGVALAVFSLTKNDQETNPMSHIFPKLAKCTYTNFGSSGTIQKYDALCVLPLNIVNEKIYIILWIWFYILAVLSFLALVIRGFTVFSKNVRIYLLLGQVGHLNKNVTSAVVKNISYGDWFVLSLIGKNINPDIFQDLLHDLCHKMLSSKNINHSF